ncbi:RNA polymerase II-associated [Flagelloscypha sp. PMI_526]|nr:RNA polymerase II-associated [Flagelloscypha sp. PMI_526]
MSGVKKSKLDLLVRVRYANPIPPPPCPPKLLNIPTNPNRYTRPEFLDAIADDAPIPMVIDAECGMPLDLSHWDCLWDDEADDSELNPDPDNLPNIDPKDLFLLEDLGGVATLATGPPTAGPSSNAHVAPAHVSWLRKTEYLSREVSTKSASADSTLQPIFDSSFVENNDNFDLSILTHPTNPNVTAVESFEILPDLDIWSNQYDLVRFSERPGERSEDDPRLDSALLRPLKTEHETFLSYYLPEDDESADRLKSARASVQPYEAASEQIILKFVRDYEPINIESEVKKEIILDIERKMTLKKKRQGAFDADSEERWEIIQFKHVEMEADELEEREGLLVEMNDPNYVANHTRDADGEIDDTFAEEAEEALAGVNGIGEYGSGRVDDIEI